MSEHLYYVVGPDEHAASEYWLHAFLRKEGYQVIAYHKRRQGQTLSRLADIIASLRILFSVLVESSRDARIVYYDITSDALYMGLALRILHMRRRVLLVNFMGSDSMESYSKIKRMLIRAAFGQITATVNNRKLADAYSLGLDLAQSKFIVMPDSTADFGEFLLEWKDISDGGYVFMGGNTRRDFSLFLETARGLPNIPFVLVTSRANTDRVKGAPANVLIHYDLSFADFIRMIANCRFLFIPLSSDAQGGQLVLFQGALLQKALITTDNVAIHTFFDQDSAILVPIGDREFSIESVERLYWDDDEIRRRGLEAYRRIVALSPERLYPLLRDLLR